LHALLAGEPAVQISAPTPPVVSGTTTPPSINIQGDNPAIVQVGDTYEDLGAIATDNQGGTLGYKTFLDGTRGTGRFPQAGTAPLPSLRPWDPSSERFP